MYLSIVKYASREINSKLTHISSIYNHMDYSSDERHDYCIFDDYGNVRWGDDACSPQELNWFFAGRRSGDGLRYAGQSSLGLRFLSYPMWIVIVTRR
jgi:hypothetical protein